MQKETHTKRNCDNCNKEYFADNRNLKRGWGLCCSKSCAASKREKSKSSYDPARVAFNNKRRSKWAKGGVRKELVYFNEWINPFDDIEDPDDSEYWNGKDY